MAWGSFDQKVRATTQARAGESNGGGKRCVLKMVPSQGTKRIKAGRQRERRKRNGSLS